jgi:hypothetical protein
MTHHLYTSIHRSYHHINDHRHMTCHGPIPFMRSTETTVSASYEHMKDDDDDEDDDDGSIQSS